MRVATAAGLSIGAIAVLALSLVYGLSEWKVRRTHDAPLMAPAPAAPADPSAGEHMARVVGCWAGCHGKEGEGGTDTLDGLRTVTAPTLTSVMPLYGDAELARLVRYGVKRDGRSAIGMASYTWWPLGDQDLADIFAHLRAQPARPPVPRARSITWRGRLGLVTGAWKVSADQVDRTIPRWGELPRRNAFERGRYLASIVCSECHGLDFRGFPLEGGPSLAVIAIYDRAQFGTLLQTGRPIGGRAIPKMSWMADVGFTEREIDDLYAFLREYHAQ